MNENVKMISIKTTNPSRINSSLLTSVGKITFDIDGYAEVTEEQATSLCQSWSDIIIENKPIKQSTSQTLIKEEGKIVTPPSNITTIPPHIVDPTLEYKLRVKEFIDDLDKAISEKIEPSIIQIKFNILSKYVEKYNLSDINLEKYKEFLPKVETKENENSDDKKVSTEEEIETYRKLLKKSTVIEIQKMLKQSPLPESEWGTLYKADLIEYCIKNLNRIEENQSTTTNENK